MADGSRSFNFPLPQRSRLRAGEIVVDLFADVGYPNEALRQTLSQVDRRAEMVANLIYWLAEMTGHGAQLRPWLGRVYHLCHEFRRIDTEIVHCFDAQRANAIKVCAQCVQPNRQCVPDCRQLSQVVPVDSSCPFPPKSIANAQRPRELTSRFLRSVLQSVTQSVSDGKGKLQQCLLPIQQCVRVSDKRPGGAFEHGKKNDGSARNRGHLGLNSSQDEQALKGIELGFSIRFVTGYFHCHSANTIRCLCNAQRHKAQKQRRTDANDCSNRTPRLPPHVALFGQWPTLTDTVFPAHSNPPSTLKEFCHCGAAWAKRSGLHTYSPASLPSKPQASFSADALRAETAWESELPSRRLGARLIAVLQPTQLDAWLTHPELFA